MIGTLKAVYGAEVTTIPAGGDMDGKTIAAKWFNEDYEGQWRDALAVDIDAAIAAAREQTKKECSLECGYDHK